MYICININSRVTELYHTLRSIKDNQRLLRVKIQNEENTQRSLTQKSDQNKDCQSSLSKDLRDRKHKTHTQETPHTHCGTHKWCRDSAEALLIKLFHGGFHPGRYEV